MAPEFIKRVYSQGKLAGFYHGTTICVLREVPGSAIFFFGRYKLEDIFNDYEPTQKMSKRVKCILSGGFAGCLAWCFGMPIDAVKSYILTCEQKEMKIGKAIKHIWDLSGIKGFYFGLLPTLFRAFPSAAVMFSVYDFIALS